MRIARLMLSLLLFSCTLDVARAQDEAGGATVVETLTEQAEALRSFVRSGAAREFLGAVPELPLIEAPRIVYRNGQTRDAMSEDEWTASGRKELGDYKRHELDGSFYYMTMYGTPLAFVRPLDLLGQAGLETLDGIRIADYGFGSIGQLRLLAANGASAHGIDVDLLLKSLYNQPMDTGGIPRARSAGDGPSGELQLHFGYFPEDSALVSALGVGFDVFVSKNTLKKGYVNPPVEVDPRRRLRLGVGEETYVRAVYDLLKPGGFFMIYNLCPGQSEEEYNPQADGRCPFSRALLEGVGFTVIAFDTDDTAQARTMGKLFGWGEFMDLETDLFGMYTLAHK